MKRALSGSTRHHLQALLRLRSFHAVAGTGNYLAPVSSSIQWRSTTIDRRYFSDKSGEHEGTTKGEEATATEGEEAVEKEEGAEGEAETKEEAEVSREEELAKEVRDLKDQLLRSLAEQDNTRRIAKRDVESARNFAIKSFAKSLLDTSDNLSRALEAVPEDVREDKDNHPVLANLYEGIQMTETGLHKAFESNGLVQYGEIGEEFDPNKHEALFKYQDPNAEPNTVGQIMKKGFMLNNRVLRSAEVGIVAKEP